MKIKKMLALLLALVMILGMVACGSTPAADAPAADAPAADAPAADTPKELVKVTLSAQPAAHSLGIFVAKEKGWFEEEGLDVEILTYISGGPQLEAAASGAWSIGIMGAPAGVNGAANFDLYTLGFSVWDYPSQRLFVRADSDIAAAGAGALAEYPEIYGNADLWKGKDIICTKGSLGHLQLLATLNALGLTEEDVNVIHMEMAAGYQAFLAGEADAICAWSTFTSDLLSQGYIQASSAEAAKLFVPSNIMASAAALEDVETSQKIVNVIFRGTMWANENKAEAAEIYYNVCEEEGVTCTMEYAQQYLAEHSAPTIEEYYAMYENGDFEKILADVMGYFVDAGTYSEEQVDAVVASFRGDMLYNAIKYYEEHYAN